MWSQVAFVRYWPIMVFSPSPYGRPTGRKTQAELVERSGSEVELRTLD